MEPKAPVQVDVVGFEIGKDCPAPIIGVNVSGLLFIGGYKRDDTFGLQQRYIDFTYKAIEMMMNETTARLLLIPHTLGTGSESDSNVCAQLYEELKDKFPGRIGYVRGYYSAAEMKHIIGHCNFFMGARMHACIGALSQGIPAISLAYSRKFIGVLDTLGVPDLVIDLRETGLETALWKVRDLYNTRTETAAVLKAKMPEVRRTILNLPAEMCDEGAKHLTRTVLSAEPQSKLVS
jgi:polysaccharide pyruvyl transferase WcaK-like protein